MMKMIIELLHPVLPCREEFVDSAIHVSSVCLVVTRYCWGGGDADV
jgi:hypothetical protein